MLNKTLVVAGFRAVLEAIESGKTLERVLIQNDLQGELFRDVRSKLKEHQVNWQVVPAAKLNSISKSNHQGIIAMISPIAFANLEEIVGIKFESGKAPLLLMLDGITDVRNFGAICRSAECFGVDAVIIPEHGAARISDDAVKTSAGALLHIPICKVKNLADTCTYLSSVGIRIFIASEKAATSITQTDFNHPICIIMGNEEKGVRKELAIHADDHLKIPLQGKTGSLNVSNATAIFLFEALRQRSLS